MNTESNTLPQSEHHNPSAEKLEVDEMAVARNLMAMMRQLPRELKGDVSREVVARADPFTGLLTMIGDEAVISNPSEHDARLSLSAAKDFVNNAEYFGISNYQITNGQLSERGQNNLAAAIHEYNQAGGRLESRPAA